MDIDDLGKMEFKDLDKPVPTGRSGRVLVGVIFLAFAAFLAVAGYRNFFVNNIPAIVSILIAIGLGFLGVRLVMMADGEHLFGIVASFVTALVMMVGGLAATALLFKVPDTRSIAVLSVCIISLVAGGGWLLRSAIRRKRES